MSNQSLQNTQGLAKILASNLRNIIDGIEDEELKSELLRALEEDQVFDATKLEEGLFQLAEALRWKLNQPEATYTFPDELVAAINNVPTWRYTLQGNWQLKESASVGVTDPGVPGYYGTQTIKFYGYYNYESCDGVDMIFSQTTAGQHSFSVGENTFVFARGTENTWTDCPLKNRIIGFGDVPQEVEPEFYEWFIENATSTYDYVNLPVYTLESQGLPNEDIYEPIKIDDCPLWSRSWAPIGQGHIITFNAEYIILSMDLSYVGPSTSSGVQLFPLCDQPIYKNDGTSWTNTTTQNLGQQDFASGKYCVFELETIWRSYNDGITTIYDFKLYDSENTDETPSGSYTFDFTEFVGTIKYIKKSDLDNIY